jgi:GDPmannose 4,6-dehydratase
MHGLDQQIHTGKGDAAAPLKLHMHYGDVLDINSLVSVFIKVRPDEIYNLAAQSHVKISFEMPEYTADTDGFGTLKLLEAIRNNNLEKITRFYQASTSELFGKVQETPQSENTPFYPRSPYGCAKVYAFFLGRVYRESYGMKVYNGILFNHESPRRGSNFVTSKVIKTAIMIKKGLADKLEMGNLDSYRDWGHSYDYVRAMHLILQQEEPSDYVVATGETRSVRELCDYVFSYIGLNYSDYVVQNEKYLRPEELPYLKGDSSRIRRLGWKPSYTFEQMLTEMIEHWIKII